MQYHLAKTATLDAQIMTVSIESPPNDPSALGRNKESALANREQRGFRCNILVQRDHYRFPRHTANAIQWLISQLRYDGLFSERIGT